MTDETTLQGVSQPEGQDATVSEAMDNVAEATVDQAEQAPEPVGPLTREQKLQRVAEAARAQREADRKAMALINNPDLTEEEYDASQVAADEPEAGLSPEQEESAEHAGDPGEEQRPPETGWYERDDGTRVKRLKINGELREFTEEEYDRAVSKEFAGDQKLRLAAERQRLLDERERQLQQELERLQEAASQSPRELPTGQSEEEFEEKLKKYHDALYDGDTDTASSIMKELYAGRQTPTPNIEALVDQAVTKRAAAEEQERHTARVHAGWAKFNEFYPDLVHDEAKLAYTDARLKQLYQNNPSMPPDELILEAGRIASAELRAAEARESAKEGAALADASQTADRMMRKVKLKSVPRPGTTARANDAPPKVDMSPRAKIARIRAGRAI